MWKCALLISYSAYIRSLPKNWQISVDGYTWGLQSGGFDLASIHVDHHQIFFHALTFQDRNRHKPPSSEHSQAVERKSCPRDVKSNTDLAELLQPRPVDRVPVWQTPDHHSYGFHGQQF